jgi:hypothetical protein
MITERIRKDLLERGSEKPLSPPPLNYKGLIKLLEKSDIEFVDVNINEAYAIATFKKVYIDMDVLMREDDRFLFFIILHEYCHALRINKIGKKGMIDALSIDKFDDMADHVIYEELLADRYGRLKFHQLNKEVFPAYRTQRLFNETQRENYKSRIKPLHGIIQHSEEKYNELINRFLI